GPTLIDHALIADWPGLATMTLPISHEPLGRNATVAGPHERQIVCPERPAADQLIRAGALRVQNVVEEFAVIEVTAAADQRYHRCGSLSWGRISGTGMPALSRASL